MVFLTVGTQLPFERLVQSVDKWAGLNPDMPVFAQIGETLYRPKYMEFVERISPAEYAEKFSAARVVVSHVGMGTIISGLENAKPLVLMPRLASLGEHRNDHQLGTARKFSDRAIIDIVESEQALLEALNLRLQGLGGGESAKDELVTSPELLRKIQSFVED